ncbi:MAG: type VI secretion system baseplate subunit TssK [Acidobacteriia bacterium]|nr:type VI secretion system baseplate subunit TssK [Terriglobia bacterium]
MKAHDIPEAIQWHEGMLLTPEHFQQMNTRQEMLAGYGLSCVPYQWGVRRLEWDANLLTSGLLYVTEVEAVLPDGLVASLGTPDALKLELKPFIEQMKQAPVPVCLVVPRRKALTAEGDLERYECLSPEPFSDHDEGREPGASGIPRLRPRLSLLAGPIPPKYCGFPLMRLRYENEVFTAWPDHPVLAVPLSSRLGTLCSLIARHVRERALCLADQVYGRGNGPSLETETHTRRLIHSLVCALPAFEAALYTGETHPYTLYLALCSLAGSIAGVGLSLVPQVFAPYDHNNPYRSFEEVKNYTFQAITEGISETWASFRFHRDGHIFVLPAKTGWSNLSTEAGMVLALRGPSGSSDQAMMSWGNSCVLGSSTVISSLVTKRILGVPRHHVEAADGLIPGKGMLLFELDSHSEFILPQEDLHAFDRRPDAISPADLILFVRKPETSGKIL